MIVLVVIIYLLLVFYEFVPLYKQNKQKLWPEFWVNVVLGTISFTMAILISLNKRIPSPEKPIREFITSIFGK